MGMWENILPEVLLDDFAYGESWTNGVDLNLHVVARFSLGNEDHEALDPSDSVTATARFFDVKLVFFTFLNWLVEGTFKAHAFHLICFRLASSSGENKDADADGYGRTFASARTSNQSRTKGPSLLRVLIAAYA
jgi:hypothetical protein